MTKLDKLLATTAFAALLGIGLAAVPQDASAQAMNPCASKTAKPDAGKSKSYDLLFPQMPGQNG